MPCIKCGSQEVATTAGLCRQCSIFEQSRVYVAFEEKLGVRPMDPAVTAAAAKFIDSTRNLSRRILPPDGVQRLPWDAYFLAICDAVKLRSIDKDTQNGAVIINEHKRVVSTGYNAFPAGVDDSFWPKDRETKVRVPYFGFKRAESPVRPGGQVRFASELSLGKSNSYEVDKYMAMTHAEMNAVVSAGQDLHRCCIYTLLFPCHECAKAIITSGIRRVVYVTTREDPSWAVAKELFVQAGVEMVGPEKP